jgi:hypothetical protein
MAEPFGIVAGAVGIAAAFTACADCFQYIQVGRHFGRDFQTDLLSLDCASLRLARWGQGVNIFGDPKLGRPDATSAEIQTVKDCLLQILVLFEDTEKISKGYRINAKAGDDVSTLLISDMDPTTLSLRDKLKSLATRKRKGSSILKTTSWALYRKSELAELITNITSLIDNIERLFPATQAQLALVEREIIELRDGYTLEHVEKAAQGVDDMLFQAARETRIGHQYSNMKIKGRSHLGDMFGSNWTGDAVGLSHSYDNVLLDKDGKASMGNKYGGKDFWDD